MNTHLTRTGMKKASITLFSVFCLLLFSFPSLFPPPLASAQSVIATIPFNSRARLLAVNPVTNRIYVVNDDIPGIGVIDGSTNAVLTEIPTGGFQVGIAVNPQTNTVYVSQQFALTINVID